MNCTLALRNLMIRGLIEQHASSTPDVKSYSLSFDFVRHLGVSCIDQLPKYVELHKVEDLPQEAISESAPAV